jgi:hypothetical protein
MVDHMLRLERGQRKPIFPQNAQGVIKSRKMLHPSRTEGLLGLGIAYACLGFSLFPCPRL